MNDSSVPPTEYHKLLGEVQVQGLFKRTYFHYGLCGGFALGVMAASLYILTLTDNVFLQALNGVLFAFASVQLGMIGHDLSHGEVFASEKNNRTFAVIVWSLLGGLSEGRWHEKHNRHHQHPNHIGYDPDVGIPFMFTQKQVAVRSSFLTRWVLPYQHVLFWLALTFTYLWNISLSLGFALRERSLKTWTEMFLILVHFHPFLNPSDSAPNAMKRGALLRVAPLTLRAEKPLPYPEHPQTLAEHLKKRRTILKATQKAMARDMSVNIWSYIGWELGWKTPTMRLWPRIIALLGYDPHPAPRTLGEHLQAKYRELGVPRSEVARRLGLAEGSLKAYEEGTWEPGRKNRALIARFLATHPSNSAACT